MTVSFQIVWLKNCWYTKIMLLGWTLLDNISAFGFSGKADFLESVFFHNFGLVQGNCIVNAMLFINKYSVNLFIISFYELIKIPIVIIKAKLKFFCLAFFSSKAVELF